MLEVSSKIHINSSVDKIWQVISKPGHLESVHPFCKINSIIEFKNDEIKKDLIIYSNNLTYIRTFVTWDFEKGYELLIGKKNGKKSKVKWSIETNLNGSFLNITIIPYKTSRVNKIIYPLFHYFIIKPKLKKYLFSVLNGVKWNVEKKKPVMKNQFGKHSWFS